MESEEFEQIPWSGLVAQAQPAVDPKWYVAGGIVGAVVVVLLALRMFSGSAPSPVAPMLATAHTPVETVVTLVEEPVASAADGAITEADLRAIDVPIAEGRDRSVAQFIAEWFVTDYFTRDRSTETIESLEVLMTVDDAAALPHLTYDGDDTFVEWARTFAFEYVGENLVDVSVAFRTVHRGEEGFVRDPVRAVMVGISDWETDPTVADIPVAIDLP